jgi:hypothetical protein
MAINSYRDLHAWQLGMTLAEEVYALTRAFPKDELFGLTSQLRRAATGIPSHVAEGQSTWNERVPTLRHDCPWFTGGM